MAEEGEFSGTTHYIAESLFENLKAMGFTDVAIYKSIIAGCINEDSCTQWISMHLDHPELNTPLEPDVRVLIKHKVVLTAEEKERKVEELKAKIAATKAAESESAVEAEAAAVKSRMATAKAMLEAKELRDEEQRKAIRYQRAKEKEEDLKAKERVHLQLSIDKLMRKGMSAEDAENTAKLEAEEAKKRRREEAESHAADIPVPMRSVQAPSASSASGGGSWDVSRVLGTTPAASNFVEPTDLPDPNIEGFALLVSQMKEFQKDPAMLLNTLNMLRTIVANIVQTPLDAKKRNIKTTSNAYQTRIAVTKCALSFLRLAGFEVGVLDDNSQVLIMNTVILRRLHLALAAIDG